MKKLLLGLLALNLLTACTKEDSEPITKTSILIGKDWIRTASTRTDNGVTTDTHTPLSACDKDDFMRFEESGDLLYDEGATKCASATQQSTYGTWSLDEEKMVLNLDITNGHKGERTVTELSDNTLTFTQTVSNRLYTYTFTKR
jgi:hypothetical protein